MARTLATIVTFRRTTKLRHVLDSLATQTHLPHQLLIIDNDASDSVQDLCEVHPISRRITYIGTQENLGPAGGTALAMEYFAEHYGDDDWFTRLDDDKPAPDDDLLSDLINFAESQDNNCGQFGGVGIAGGRWDSKRARLEKVPVLPHETGAQVDYLATNFFPLFSGHAIRRVGPMDSTLFFGMSEVEYGLRLRRAGYSLWLHGDRVRQRRGPSGYSGGVVVSPNLEPATWRRYYSLRNSIIVARRYGGIVPAMRVTLIRALGKPIWSLPRSPGLALAHLRLGLRASFDGWTGRMGRRIDPLVWERRHGLLDDQGEMRPT